MMLRPGFLQSSVGTFPCPFIYILPYCTPLQYSRLENPMDAGMNSSNHCTLHLSDAGFIFTSALTVELWMRTKTVKTISFFIMDFLFPLKSQFPLGPKSFLRHLHHRSMRAKLSPYILPMLSRRGAMCGLSTFGHTELSFPSN